MGFGKVLAGIMQAQGLNQLQLAKLLGIRQSQISNWLNGKSYPGYFSLKILCQKLYVSAEDLLETKS